MSAIQSPGVSKGPIFPESRRSKKFDYTQSPHVSAAKMRDLAGGRLH